LPDQAPEAVQVVAFAADQFSVEVEPIFTVLGLALKFTMGADSEPTVTVADCCALPPLPSQLRVKVAFPDSAAVDTDPLAALTPDQAPEAVQVAALAEDQVSLDLSPFATVPGRALRLRVGAGAVTVTATDCEVTPPAPAQVSV
jgi:hypothetical protein